MNLQKQIEKILKLDFEMFPENKEKSKANMSKIVAHLVKEIGEFHGTSRSFFGRQYSPEKVATLDHICEELGDILFLIIVLCKMMDISIKDALDTAINKLQQRFNDYNKATINCPYIPKNIDKLKFPKDHQPFKYDTEDKINQ